MSTAVASGLQAMLRGTFVCEKSGRVCHERVKPTRHINQKSDIADVERESVVKKPIQVGIAGANAQRGWARDAHIPALKTLSQQFVLSALSARDDELAQAARAEFGARRAFGDSLAMVRDADIDLVSVCVKVPEHRAIVLAALAAGKHVYCEWPLGRDMAEAREMAAAVPAGCHAVVGLQALSAPPLQQAIRFMREGRIGKPILIRVFSPTVGWGSQAPAFYAYLQDKKNGATLATIAGGHTLAAVEALVDDYVEVEARSSILNPRPRIGDFDEIVERTCADYMAITGRHASGCVSTVEIMGGCNRPFQLEVTGDRGWIRVTGNGPGGFQTAALMLEASFAIDSSPPLVSSTLKGPPLYLAESYARLGNDIQSQQYTLPDFARAVRLTRLLDAVEIASEQGRRQFL